MKDCSIHRGVDLHYNFKDNGKFQFIELFNDTDL